MLAEEVAACREEMHRSRGREGGRRAAHLPQGVLFPGIGQLERSRSFHSLGFPTWTASQRAAELRAASWPSCWTTCGCGSAGTWGPEVRDRLRRGWGGSDGAQISLHCRFYQPRYCEPLVPISGSVMGLVRCRLGPGGAGYRL